jgi:hypothetical protein
MKMLKMYQKRSIKRQTNPKETLHILIRTVIAMYRWEVCDSIVPPPRTIIPALKQVRAKYIIPAIVNSAMINPITRKLRRKEKSFLVIKTTGKPVNKARSHYGRLIDDGEILTLCIENSNVQRYKMTTSATKSKSAKYCLVLSCVVQCQFFSSW